MMKLDGRTIDDWGNVLVDEQGLYDLMMKGTDISGLQVQDGPEVRQFNQLCREFDRADDALTIYEQPTQDLDEFDQENQHAWFTPEPFASIDVHDWLLMRCYSVEEVQRIEEEWALFVQRDMEQVLRHLLFLVDHFRQNGIVWGVGRGSSVSSYALYLMGVHKINSIKYGLDIAEFLKD